MDFSIDSSKLVVANRVGTLMVIFCGKTEKQFRKIRMKNEIDYVKYITK